MHRGLRHSCPEDGGKDEGVVLQGNFVDPLSINTSWDARPIKKDIALVFMIFNTKIDSKC
jgi:hypothetical protein